MTKKISVVMSVFNQERFLKESILSILSQNFRNFEFLILNDGSTDNSLMIIKSFKDKRIKIFQNRQKKGLARSLNYLITKAKGEYIARMDGDDISLPNRFKEQVGFLNQHKKIALAGSWAIIINNQGKTVGKIKYSQGYKDIRKDILNDNPFIHPSVMFRKNIFLKVGGYDETLLYSQDYDLFLRLVCNYQCVNIPKFLFKFRWGPDFSKQKKQHLSALKIRLNAIKKHGYSKFEYLKVIKPALLYLIPAFVKSYYWSKKFR